MMITNPALHSQELTPQQIRSARRVAILLLVAVVPSIGLLGFLAYQSGAWQLVVETGNMTAYGIVLLVSFRLIRRNRVLLGMRILLIGMGLGLLALNLLIGGLGVLLGIAASLLITAIATLTLPESTATPAIIVSFGLGLFIVLLDALLPVYRLLVPALNVYVPGTVVVLSVVCIYLIVRQFGSFSMRGKLTLTLLLVAIVPVVLQAVAFTFLAQSRLTSISQQDLLSSAKQTAARITSFIDDGLLDVRSSTLLPDVIDVLSTPADKRDTTRVAAIFDALGGRSRYIRSYAVFDANGIDVFDTNRSNIGTNQLNQPYIQNPLQTSKPYVSDVLFDQVSGEGLLHFSAPVRAANGNLIGVTQAAYSVTAMQDLVKLSSDLQNTGQFGLLFDENHFRLADGSNTNANQLPFKLIMPLPPEQLATLRAAQRLPAGDITELTANLPELEAGLKQAAQQPFFVAELGETVDKGESHDVPDQMAVFKLGWRPWLVVFGETQSALLAPITDLARSSLFLVLALSAVTIFIAARVSRTLARPILSLNEAAGKVAQGDLSVRAIVDTSDETGLLAATFNSMTEQLGSLVTTLEDRVRARTDQLRASAEVGHAATSILNPDQLLKQVVDLITARFRFYYAAVFVVDEQNQQAVLRAATGEAGRYLLEHNHRLLLNEESMVGAAIVTSHPKIALDVGQDAVRFANPLLPKTRSEIALPLRVGDRNLGALDVQSEQVGAFDESNTEVLQTMADQIAVALFNAETFQRSEQQADTLALLNQLSRNLATVTSLEDIASTVVPIMRGLLGQTHLSIVQQTANPQILALREFTDDPDRPVSDSEAIQTAGSLIGQCVERNEVTYTADLGELVDHYSDVAGFYQQGLRSSVILPLRVGERVLGTFNVSADRPHAYSTEQINQLEQITSQLAITVENLNLGEKTQQTLAELDAANRRLVGQAWEQHTRTVKLEAAEWRNGDWNVLKHSTAPRDTSQALVPATTLSLPIRVRGTTIGEFNITAAGARPAWGTEEVAFAQSLVDQVGQVLETARLLDETERVAQREKAVASAADKIHRSGDVESVLQSAVTELQRITGRHGISVQLGFGRSGPTNDQALDRKTGGER